jgi:hypothetical protein
MVLRSGVALLHTRLHWSFRIVTPIGNVYFGKAMYKNFSYITSCSPFT